MDGKVFLTATIVAVIKMSKKQIQNASFAEWPENWEIFKHFEQCNIFDTEIRRVSGSVMHFAFSN
jgi:hypothetical protein